MLVLEQYTHKAETTARFRVAYEEPTLVVRGLEATHRCKSVVFRDCLWRAQVPPGCRHLTDEAQRTWCVK